MSLSFHPWSGVDGLRSGFHAWPSMLADTGADPLCNDPEWTLAYIASWLDDADVFGWTVHEGDQPVALLAFRREPSRGLLALPRATLATDGTFDSDYLDLWIRPGREAEVVSSLLDELAKTRSLGAMVLAGIPADSAVLSALTAELEKRGLPRREREVACLSATLPEDFESYVASLGKRMRSKVRQALRRAEEAGATFTWCDDPLALAAHLQGLFDLHAKRWNEVGEPGSFADENRRNFFARLARYQFTRGALRFARLEIDDEPIGYQFGALQGGRYYQLQEGFDPAEERFRIGTALRAWVVRELIEEGVRDYDFMAGDTRHKRDWGAEPRPCRTVAFALPRLRARLAYGVRAWLDSRG